MADVRELSSSPSMLSMFARAGLGMVPGVSRLPLIGGTRRKELPDTVLARNDVSFQRERVVDYARVCEFSLSDTLPVTYLHMLAFPLHLSLMTDPSFPFPAIGLVHIYNRIVSHRPVSMGETASLRVWAGELEPHPRGQQFSLHSEARVAGELVWEEVSVNLRRGQGSEGATAPAVASSQELATAESWELPDDLGRRYGAVSGDLNPIHIHPLTARLFGFPAAIAHGMWTKARCLAALQSRLPDSFTVQVAFRKPILLPATVEFAVASDASAFGVRGAGKPTPHLDGRIEPV